MKKAINTLALLTFIWLVLDALRIPNMFLNFLLAGELPFSETTLSPGLMIVLVTAVAGLIAIEVMIRRLSLAHRARSLAPKRGHLPKRRFGRA